MQDIESGNTDINVIGIERRGVAVTPYKEAMMEMDWVCGRPKEQSFMNWRNLVDTLAKPDPVA